ncbi:TonB-dependent receptor [Rhizobium sp. CRIBSB]|nr:TonB-dependent receptor [Rhizobium sp. CRIBSB]
MMARRRGILSIVCLLAWICGSLPALAQTPVASDEAVGQDGQSGVLSFPPEFFAEARPTTASEMVGRVPGFVMIDNEQDVRGLAGATGNILVDGQVPALKSVSLRSFLQRIPAGTVERIDLIRGGAPGIDMQGQPVVLNIIRRGGSYSTLSSTVFVKVYPEGGPGGHARIEASRRSDAFSLEGTLSFRDELIQMDSGEGPVSLRSADGTLIQSGDYGTDFRTLALEGGLAAELDLGSGNLRLNSTLRSNNNDRNELYELINVVTGPVRETTASAFESTGGELGADLEHRLSDRWLSRLVLIQTYERDTQRSGSTGRRAPEEANEIAVAMESILRGTATFQASETLKLEFGAEGAFNSLDVESSLLSDGVPVILPVANVLIEEGRADGFVAASWSPMDGIDLELSGRYERSTISLSGDARQEKTLSYFKPRFLAGWAVRPGTQLRLRLEREVGQLDFEDFAASTDFGEGVVSAGNPDLEPEVADVFEVTAEQRFWDRGALLLSYRHDRVQQVVDLIPVAGRFDAPGNIGDGTRDEVRLSLTLPLDRLGVSGGIVRFNGTRRWSSVTDPVTGQDRRISGERPFEGDVQISRDLPSLRSTVVLEGDLAYSSRSYRLRQVQTIEQGGWWKLFWEYTPQPDLAFRFQVENFSSRERTRIRELYSGPRDVAGISAIEHRSATFEPFFFARVRKTF